MKDELLLALLYEYTTEGFFLAYCVFCTKNTVRISPFIPVFFFFFKLLSEKWKTLKCLVINGTSSIFIARNEFETFLVVFWKLVVWAIGRCKTLGNWYCVRWMSVWWWWWWWDSWNALLPWQSFGGACFLSSLSSDNDFCNTALEV